MASELGKISKEQELLGVYLLYGNEIYLVENCLKKIKKTFGELKDGLNYIKFQNPSSDAIIAELQTPPFGFDRKLIVVRASELLQKQVKKKNAAVQDEIEKLTAYMERNVDEIKNQNVLVFVEEDIEKNSLYKLIDKIGRIYEFKPESTLDIVKRIKFICNSYSVNIDNNTISYFIECCGTNLQELINEIMKLIEYTGLNGTITKEDIDALCIKKFESVIFDLTDSLGQKNVDVALAVLRNLIYSKEPIQKILITLYNHFKKLYIVKLCEKYKVDVLSNLNLKPNQTFLVSKYKRQSGYFSEENLRAIVMGLIELDEKYKNGNIDLNIGIESLLCVYCSK